MVKHGTGRAAVLATIAAALVSGNYGCTSGSGLVKSNLAGWWSIESSETIEIDAKGERRVRKGDGDTEFPVRLVFEDGTFDWSRTMLALYSMATGRPLTLNHKGDRISFTREQTGGPRGYIEVVESLYTVNQSCVILRQYDASSGQSAALEFRAYLQLNGTTVYEVSENMPEREPVSRMVLVRWTKPPPITSVEELDGVRAEGELLHFVAETQGIRCLAWSPDGRRIVTAGDEKIIHVWDAETGELVGRLKGHKNPVVAVRFSPDGRFILSGSDRAQSTESKRPSDRTVRLWDAETGEEVRHFDGIPHFIKSVGFSPDGRQVIAGGSVERLPEAHLLPARAFDAESVRIWDLETGTEVRRLLYVDLVGSVAFSPDGKLILAACTFLSDELRIQLWDADSGRRIDTFMANKDYAERQLCSAIFTPDGQHVVTCGAEKVNIWDVHTAKLVRRCLGQEGLVWSVDCSSDGRRLLSGADDGTVRLWRFDTGEEIACFKDEPGNTDCVAISSDGKRAISGGGWGLVRVWRLPE